jgi:muramoyltetrapeptide carboxypeptidase
MNRRFFIKSSSLMVFAGNTFPSKGIAMTDLEYGKKNKLIKAARLKPGATIGLIAPASPPALVKIEKAFANLSALGYNVKPGEHLYATNGHLAGTDAQRVFDIHRAFSDPEVDAVWCLRGGYGCTRLLPFLDYNLIKKHPKPFIGYSDITALHLAIHQKTGLVTFHGPVTASDFPENTLQHFKATLILPQTPYQVISPLSDETLPGDEYKPFVITAGRVAAPLIGGNLALLSAMAGTEFSPSYRKKLVFIEDVGEQPYRIDRMLTQLLQATDLSKAAGIVLGVFADCQPKGEGASMSLAETLRDRLGGLGMPVFYGLPFGHVAHQMTFPYGIQAEMDTENMSLTLLESAVV